MHGLEDVVNNEVFFAYHLNIDSFIDSKMQ